MRRQRIALAGLLLLATLGSLLAASRVTQEARDAMATQVRGSAGATAAERAAVMSEALGAARERIRVTSRYEIVRAAVELRERELLRNALEQANRSPGVTAGAITDAAGAVLARAGGAMDLAGTDELRFRPTAEGRDAIVTISVPILDGEGRAIGRAHQEYALGRLVPRFVTPLPGRTGSMSLVRSDGSPLLSTSRDAPTSPRLTAAAPVAGTGLTAVAAIARTAADQPAAALVWRLTKVLATTITAGLLIVGLAALLLGLGRRRLVAEREAATVLAATDPLTHLGNRRALDDALLEIETRTGRTAIVLVDLDRLKVLNDTLGHAAGDAGLRELGDALRACVRPHDLVARIGGDEFAIVLPDAGAVHAAQVAERVRDAVAEIDVEGFGALSACTGVAAGPNDQVARTLAHADEDLYEAKRARPTRPTLTARLRYVIDRHDLASAERP